MADSGDDNLKLKITINVDSILIPAQQVAITATEVVDFVLDSLAKADLSKKPENENTTFKFKTPDVSAEERKATYESWILARGMQDLLRGLRKSLEQAHVLLNLLDVKEIKSSTTLEQFLAPFRLKAATLTFVDLLTGLNSRIPEPLNFIDAYNSLQQARNCLEHRNGVVGNIDAPGGGVMSGGLKRLR